jgi:8-oxo-dGTP diphosphatase
VKKFPIGEYGRQKLQFFPAPFRAPLRAFASLVFPWQEEQIRLCNIGDRGWCIPSGRVEPDESSLEAAHREALEEAGAILCNMQYIGCYRVTERMAVRWADCYVACVDALVDITRTDESLGRQLVTLEELPAIYHLWNPLTEQLFAHSKEILQRTLDRQT